MNIAKNQFDAARAFRQIAALPIYLKLWLIWLVIWTFFVPVALVWNEFFHSLLICQALNLGFGGYLMLRFGLVKLLSLSHLLFWTPMLFKFAWYFSSLETTPILVISCITIVTVSISLCLDLRDYLAWRAGDIAPMVNA